ncbi:hypothetical protein PAXINDRAFT_15239, partial [Paxillus involutus ATCC 200175]
PHNPLLDLPAFPVPKVTSHDRQQRGLDYLDLPTSRRPFTASSQPPALSATSLAVERVKRLWNGLVTRRSSSSPPQQAIELHGNQDRRFWKFSVGTPLTEVAAGHAKEGVVVGRSVPRRKKKRHHKSPKSQEPPAAAEAGPSSSHAEASTSNAGPSTSQTSLTTASNAALAGRTSSFAQSTTGSDDSWDNMDCGEQCVDYTCFGPRENREKFRPWKKKSRAVIEAEERAKKGEKKQGASKRRKSKVPKTHTAVHPLDPKRDHIQGASPASRHAVDATLERPGNDSQPDGVVPQAVSPLEEQIEQLRRQLDASVAANRKADAERDLLQKEVAALRSSGYGSRLLQDPHMHTGTDPLLNEGSLSMTSLLYTTGLSASEAHPSSLLTHPSGATSNAGPSVSPAQTQDVAHPPHPHTIQGEPVNLKVASPASHDADDTTGELVRDNQLDETVPLFSLQLQAQVDQLRQQVDDLVAAKRKMEGERNLLAMEVKDSRKPQDHTGFLVAEASPSSYAEPSGSMSTAGPSTPQAGPSTSS